MIDGLKPYAAYKDSELPWLGSYPEQWSLRRTKVLFQERVQKGFPREPLLAATQSKGVVKKEDYENRTVTAQKDLHLLKLVEKGDFVISLRSFQGGIEVAHCRGIISPAYTVLRPRALVASRYFFHFFKSRQFIESLGLFVTGIREGQNIDYGRLSRVELPLPPPDEQTAIVRFLDHANRKIDGFIRAKRKLIALLNEQKQAITHRAVTRGLDPDVLLKPSGIEWLGDIPAHWELRRAKQLCSSIVDCKNRTPDQVDGGEYVVVRTTNIRNGRFSLRGSYPTDRENFEIWTQRGAPRSGDVFFTREAPMGEACLVPELQNLCMGQRMMYMRPNPSELNPEFLLHSVYGPVVRAYIQHVSNGSTVGHLRLGQIGAIPLLWCPIEEQREIVARIRAESTPLEEAITRTEREIALMQEYRTRLTTDVVTGKLDVRVAAASLPEIVDAAADEAAIDETTDELEFEDTE